MYVSCWQNFVSNMESGNRKVPVFVFPTSLKFYVNSRQTHKQLLTVYNPYEFPVKFKGNFFFLIFTFTLFVFLVLSTAPNKYAVIDPEGSMGPLSCVDIVIRHTMPISGNCNVIDKFRITMQDHSTKEVQCFLLIIFTYLIYAVLDVRKKRCRS